MSSAALFAFMIQVRGEVYVIPEFHAGVRKVEACHSVRATEKSHDSSQRKAFHVTKDEDKALVRRERAL